jgi:hypothetical protein
MAGAIQRKTATYEDLLKVPENKVAEILDGELFESPLPGPSPRSRRRRGRRSLPSIPPLRW